MNRPIGIIGAPSSIGIKPYENGEPRALDGAPGVYRRLGLVSRVRAEDYGDVTPPPYRDFTRPSGRPRNESEMVGYNRELADIYDPKLDPDLACGQRLVELLEQVLAAG